MESASGWVGQGNPGDPTAALALGELELFGVPGSTAPFIITDYVYDVENDTFRFTWNSQPGKEYSVRYSEDLKNWDNDIVNSVTSDGGSTTYPPINLPGADNPLPGARRIFFRIQENP